jgi:hypothetical protein
MHRIIFAVALVALSTLALAQDRPGTGTGTGTGTSTGAGSATGTTSGGAAGSQDRTAASGSSDPMAGWTPRMVKNEQADRKEIMALMNAMEAAGMKGNLEAAAELVDFPVLMVTDDKNGEVTSESWDRERWTQVMAPFYEKPMTGMKVTHKPTIFLLTDSLATVTDQTTMQMGKQKVTSRNAMHLVRTGGKWKVKSMVEGGWGDVMAKQATGAASTSTGSQATGTGSQGTGTGSGTTGTGSQSSGSSSTGTQSPPSTTPPTK